MKYIFVIIYSIILPILSFKEITPKFCFNCKYFITDNDTGEFSQCSLFQKKIDNYSFLVNRITKDEKKEYYYCSTARSTNDMCGIEGKMHKRKYNKKGIK